MKAHPIHIAFCSNDTYIPYVVVAIKSILENHDSTKISIHVLSDFISVNKQNLLKETFHSYPNACLEIHIVDDSSLKGLKDTWSIYTWYRVLLPNILPTNIHRILYLDADVIVKDNLQELFLLNMENKAIAGTIDIETFNIKTFERCGNEQEKRYICAGVMLMNLDFWRKHNLTEQIIEWGRINNDRIKFPDQDTINYLCRNDKVILPLRYGIQSAFFTNDQFYQEPLAKELSDSINKPAIIHYAGCAPWIKELSTHLLTHEWIKYNQMLPKPVKRKYMTKGWKLIKMHIWNFLHPFRYSNKLSIEDVKKRLNMIEK